MPNHIAEVHDDEYEMIDGTIIPHEIEFRGYDYYLDSTYLDEDRARISAMQQRREGIRACVKVFGDWWSIYTR